jgi:hypothetical protein
MKVCRLRNYPKYHFGPKFNRLTDIGEGGDVWVKANLLYLSITPGVNITVVYFCVHHILIGTLDKPATPSDWRRHNIYFSLFLFVIPH